LKRRIWKLQTIKIPYTTKTTTSSTISIAFSQNPANDKVTVSITDNTSLKATYTVQVCNKMGEPIFKTSINEKTITIPLSDYKEDMYLINVISENNKIKGSGILMVKH
jgi:WD40 repeat protein